LQGFSTLYLKIYVFITVWALPLSMFSELLQH